MPTVNMRSLSGTSRHRLKDKKVHIVQAKNAQLADGSWGTEYRPVHPGKVWAYRRQIGGSEYYATATAGLSESVVYFVNWRDDLTEPGEARWVVEGNRAYKVTRIDTYEGYKRDIALYCETDDKFDVDDVKPYE